MLLPTGGVVGWSQTFVTLPYLGDYLRVSTGRAPPQVDYGAATVNGVIQTAGLSRPLAVAVVRSSVQL